jgi:hypothetical protein
MKKKYLFIILLSPLALYGWACYKCECLDETAYGWGATGDSACTWACIGGKSKGKVNEKHCRSA